MERILGVDLGDRRVGLAVSDPSRVIAHGLKTIEIKGDVVLRLSKVMEEWGATEVVIGLPLNMDGSEGEMALRARNVAEELRRRVKVKVSLWDERLTSVAAHRARQEMGLQMKGRKPMIDEISAILILQGYLDNLNEGNTPVE